MNASARPLEAAQSAPLTFGTVECADEARQRADSHYRVCQVRRGRLRWCERCDQLDIAADRAERSYRMAERAARRAERGGR